jgi:alkaline phosphatase D
MNRREFLQSATAFVSLAQSGAPAIVTSESRRPQMPFGVQSGDVLADRAVVWSRADRPARLVVEYSTTESFRNPRRVAGPAALEAGDFTARVDLSGLPAGQTIFYRASFESLDDLKTSSVPVVGHFRTPPRDRRDVTIVWGGDVCGQGWGINPDVGGMTIYESMRRVEPDLFVHSGDTIYADNVILPEVTLDDGSIWRNLTTPEKSKVAETLDEFRGNHRYNLMDENLRRFNAATPTFAQWDDHEVRNNWYPGQILDDAKYTEKRIDVLAARARQAFLDYLPLRFDKADPSRIYRALPYGPLVDVLMLDERSYRGPNTANRQETMSAETAFLGTAQMAWIKSRLLASKATWKIIASDMPLGIIVEDGKTFEGVAQGNGPALGRELEIAGLLGFIKEQKIRNVVWITTDIHYCAAHLYDPSHARFTGFDPFWEFVAGPLNAGTFGPGRLDDTFGPQAVFVGIPKGLTPNRSPKAGYQFFGAIRVDARTELMTVRLHDIRGNEIYKVELIPAV